MCSRKRNGRGSHCSADGWLLSCQFLNPRFRYLILPELGRIQQGRCQLLAFSKSAPPNGDQIVIPDSLFADLFQSLTPNQTPATANVSIVPVKRPTLYVEGQM